MKEYFWRRNKGANTLIEIKKNTKTFISNKIILNKLFII